MHAHTMCTRPFLLSFSSRGLLKKGPGDEANFVYNLHVPVLPITGTKISWDGLPSLSLAFSADPWDRKTPTALQPKIL